MSLALDRRGEFGLNIEFTQFAAQSAILPNLTLA